MVNDLIAFLKRIGTPDALIGVDWVIDHPEAKGVVKAARIVKRILGRQARATKERGELIIRICYAAFQAFPLSQHRWVRRACPCWIRAVFEGRAVELLPGRLSYVVQQKCGHYLNYCTRIHGPDIVRLIQSRSRR